MGLIHIYCGDGKGKTTAACGLAIRALGADMSVVFCQFFKDGSSSEVKSLKTFENLTYLKSEIDLPRFAKMNEEQKTVASKYYSELFQKAINKAKKCDVLVLDEVISTYNYDFLSEIDVIGLLKDLSPNCEIILTGRNPSNDLIEISDYVSEIKKIKHPFDESVSARKGIEF